MFKFVFPGIFILLGLLSPSTATTVRVWLTNVPSTEKLTVSGIGLQYLTESGWAPLSSNQITVNKGTADALLTTPPALPLTITTSGTKVSIQTSKRKLYYSGAVEFQAERTALIADLEDYVANVVSAEMPAGFPLEAKKAQAVAARSYTLASSGKHKEQGTDLCDINHCHVLSAVDGIPHADEAAKATAGEILTTGGKPLFAEYSANCGGKSAEVEAGSIYRVGDDCESTGKAPFCSTAPSFAWSGRLTQQQILTVLSLKDATSIKRFSIKKRDASGRLEEIEIETDKGVSQVKGLDFRRLLGSRVVRSLLCTLTADPVTGDILLSGTGFGHGRGLCQWGARGMAMEPYNKTYKEILRHYYPGAVLSSTEISEVKETQPSP